MWISLCFSFCNPKHVKIEISDMSFSIPSWAQLMSIYITLPHSELCRLSVCIAVYGKLFILIGWVAGGCNIDKAQEGNILIHNAIQAEVLTAAV